MKEDAAPKESIHPPIEMGRREFLDLSAKAVAIAGALFALRPEKAAALAEEYLNKPGKEGRKEPVVSIEFFFSSHKTEADKKGLAARVKEADVFVPETPGWTKNLLELYRAVSRGEMTTADVAKKYGIRENPDQERDPSFFETLRAIYGSNKHIEFLDMPKDNPTIQELLLTDDKIRDMDFGRDLDAIAQEYKELLKEYAELQIKREAYILKGLEALKQKIILGEIPLQNNDWARILLSYGAIHTGLFHSVSMSENKEKEKLTKVSFRNFPYIFGYTSEAVRRFMFGKEVDNELIIRAVVERVAQTSLWDYLPGFDSQKKTAFIRKMLDKFSVEEMKKLFKVAKDDFNFNLYITAEIFKKAAGEKGINWPMLQEELDDMVSAIGRKGAFPNTAKPDQ